jgi:hypothetical protein
MDRTLVVASFPRVRYAHRLFSEGLSQSRQDLKVLENALFLTSRLCALAREYPNPKIHVR